MQSLRGSVRWALRGGLCVGLAACGVDDIDGAGDRDDPAELLADPGATDATADVDVPLATQRRRTLDFLPPPRVLSFTARGSGCGPEAKTTHALDVRAYSRVDFSDFTVVGAPSELGASKDCKLRFELQKPPTFSVALASFRVEGRASLPDRMVGHVAATVATEGSPTASVRTKLDPLARTFDFTHTFASNLTAVPCESEQGGPIDIDLTAQIARMADAAAIGAGSITIEAVREIRFVFINCQKPTP